MNRGLVAIIGRPNVGKSTLFNRITRSRDAIVHGQPGVTRDRLYGTAYYSKKKEDAFTVIDTGGFETKGFQFQPFTKNLVWEQTEAAIKEADLIILLLDAQDGLHFYDEELFRRVTQMKKPVLIAANKIDGEEQKEKLLWDLFRIGTDEIVSVSAAHNKGIHKLLAAIEGKLSSIKNLKSKNIEEDMTRVSIIGRPNAGKSSILNRLAGEERALVSDIAGTTRDSIDSVIKHNGQNYLMVDTAGIRRKTKIHEKVESFSVIRSLSSIEKADVVVLVIDAVEGMTDQDTRLARLAINKYKPLILVVNKWDLVDNKHSNSTRDYARDLQETVLKDISYVPILFVSCLENQRVHTIFKHIERVMEQTKKRVSTSQLNEAIQQIVADNPPQLAKRYSRPIRFYYGTQTLEQPPVFVAMCNISAEIKDSYQRYFMKQLKKRLGFEEVPIRVVFRGKKDAKNRKHQKELAAEEDHPSN